MNPPRHHQHPWQLGPWSSHARSAAGGAVVQPVEHHQEDPEHRKSWKLAIVRQLFLEKSCQFHHVSPKIGWKLVVRILKRRECTEKFEFIDLESQKFTLWHVTGTARREWTTVKEIDLQSRQCFTKIGAWDNWDLPPTGCNQNNSCKKKTQLLRGCNIKWTTVSVGFTKKTASLLGRLRWPKVNTRLILERCSAPVKL